MTNCPANTVRMLLVGLYFVLRQSERDNVSMAIDSKDGHSQLDVLTPIHESSTPCCFLLQTPHKAFESNRLSLLVLSVHPNSPPTFVFYCMCVCVCACVCARVCVSAWCVCHFMTTVLSSTLPLVGSAPTVSTFHFLHVTHELLAAVQMEL